MNAPKLRFPVFASMMLAASMAQGAADGNLLDEITIRVLDDDNLSEQVFDILLPLPGDELPAQPAAGNSTAPGKSGVAHDKQPKEKANQKKSERSANRGRNASSNGNQHATDAGNNAADAARQGSDRAADATDNASENASSAAASASENAKNASEHANENARNNPSKNAPGKNKK